MLKLIDEEFYHTLSKVNRLLLRLRPKCNLDEIVELEDVVDRLKLDVGNLLNREKLINKKYIDGQKNIRNN